MSDENLITIPFKNGLIAVVLGESIICNSPKLLKTKFLRSDIFSAFNNKEKFGKLWCYLLFFFYYWDSLQARLKSHYEAWSYKKSSTKKITEYRKSV